MNITHINLLREKILEITNLNNSNKDLFIDLLYKVTNYIENTKNNKIINDKNHKRRRTDNTKISSIQKFFQFYKDNENRVININLEKGKRQNLGKFSNIQFTKNGDIIKFGKFGKNDNIEKINNSFINEFRAFLFNLYLYNKSTILFPEIKEFGLFLDGKIITTYGIYKKYDCDLFDLLVGNGRRLLILRSYLEQIDFINNLMKQIMTAIKIMHDNNLVHGDIKCENILFKREIIDSKLVYNFALCDFGFTHNNGKIISSIQGSPKYISPLRIIQYLSANNNKKNIQIIINYADDYYSLGYTFFIIITTLFPNKFYKIMEGMIFGKHIKSIASDWSTNYESSLKLIFNQIDIVTKNILILFSENNQRNNPILKKFMEGLNLIKSLFASNDYNNLDVRTQETKQVINDYLEIQA